MVLLSTAGLSRPTREESYLLCPPPREMDKTGKQEDGLADSEAIESEGRTPRAAGRPGKTMTKILPPHLLHEGSRYPPDPSDNF